jgi:hypothetical protein
MSPLRRLAAILATSGMAHRAISLGTGICSLSGDITDIDQAAPIKLYS